MRFCSILAFILAFTLLSTTACKKQQFDEAKLVSMIRDEMLGPKNIKTTSVTCPKDREVKVNDKFTCEAKVASGETLTFDITVKDADGSIEANLQGEIIDPTKIASTIAPKFEMPASTTATCDRVVSKGSTPFTCELVAGSVHRTFEIKPRDGGFEFNEIGKPAAPPEDHGDAPADDKRPE